jgi:hypothetical protein
MQQDIEISSVASLLFFYLLHMHLTPGQEEILAKAFLKATVKIVPTIFERNQDMIAPEEGLSALKYL